MKWHASGSRREAFTLLELLAGMAVGILLVVLLFQIFEVASAAWQRSENQVDAYREARAALQVITRDLGSVAAQFPVNPAAPPAAGGAAPNLVLDKYPDPDPSRDPLDLQNEEAYLLTAVPNTGASSLCAVGYFCQWMPDAPPGSDPQNARTPRAYAIFRQFLGSGKNAEGAAAPQAGLYDLLKASAGRPLTFLDVFVRTRPNGLAPGGQIRAAPVQLAAYIWDLQFRIDTNLQAARGAAQPPADHGDLSPAGTRSFYTSKDGMPHPWELPAYVEVRFKALGAAGARQLEGNRSVDRRTWWDASSAFYRKVIQPSTQQFVMRAPLQSGGAGPFPSF